MKDNKKRDKVEQKQEEIKEEKHLEKFRSVKWKKIKKLQKDKAIEKERIWKKICGSKSGVYIYLTKKYQGYIFGKSRIVYIGRGKNLAHRLAWHFRRDSNGILLEKESKKTLKWPYQNYYYNNIPFDIIYTNCEKETEIERLFIGIFMSKMGVPPICNSRIEREKLVETYKYNNRGSKIIEEIREMIEKYSKQKK